MKTIKPSEDPTLLNEQQVSELLTISVKTLRNWRSARRELPFIKLGGTVRYVKAEVLGYIAKCRHTPSPAPRDTY